MHGSREERLFRISAGMKNTWGEKRGSLEQQKRGMYSSFWKCKVSCIIICLNVPEIAFGVTEKSVVEMYRKYDMATCAFSAVLV